MFQPNNIETFMGGTFGLPKHGIKTVGDLRILLRSWAQEVDDWGDDDTPISEVAIVKDRVSVTLAAGIVQ